MIFTKEYQILSNLSRKQVLQLSYTFNNQRIKLYFSNIDGNKFFVVILETNEYTLVKPYEVYSSNKDYYINMFWGDYYKYAFPLKNRDSESFTNYQQSIKDVINNFNVNHYAEYNISYSYISNTDAKSQIKRYASKSSITSKPKYFWYLKRQKMSKEKFNNACKILGSYNTKLLAKQGLSPIFTSNIEYQKSFVAIENPIKN
ncbi:hypothetical protein [Macrococcoides canis]|uniref:Uncharacterized protein n=1 Tax=Macrococcoides canis TaxID=1855823 RepID=A0A4R6C1M3_9STAP|nr:hypothetical protein [Macrococcus]TDM15139.1 hypothetical protein ETI04_10545 [Macrococcus canis]TDM29290.1 hypothetical protein ETI03_10735 [Macrococcus canis]TDM31955.1 hypothetical protein ETI13_10525 [Macrococcus canis]TDM38919.1 hypothetical protein ETI10_12635 [Macrococcus goetzii]TDM39959.1 hypothetical protein ETI09_10740 [Macrococcus canis]